MAEINVGRVRIGWKGEWDETTKYKALDAVTFEGSSYVATVDPPVGTAPTSADFWQLMAEKGADGPPGERGPQGPEGPAGTNDWDQLVNVPENLAYIGTGASQVRSNSALEGRFVQGQAGTGATQFRNNQQNDGRFLQQETAEVALGGDFPTGTPLTATRIGNVVTLSWPRIDVPGNVTVYTSRGDAIPPRFRPTGQGAPTTVFDVRTYSLSSVLILQATAQYGTFRIRSFVTSGENEGTSLFPAGSLTYAVD